MLAGLTKSADHPSTTPLSISVPVEFALTEALNKLNEGGESNIEGGSWGTHATGHGLSLTFRIGRAVGISRHLCRVPNFTTSRILS